MWPVIKSIQQRRTKTVPMTTPDVNGRSSQTTATDVSQIHNGMKEPTMTGLLQRGVEHPMAGSVCSMLTSFTALALLVQPPTITRPFVLPMVRLEMPNPYLNARAT